MTVFDKKIFPYTFSCMVRLQYRSRSPEKLQSSQARFNIGPVYGPTSETLLGRWADDGPPLMVFDSSLPLST